MKNMTQIVNELVLQIGILRKTSKIPEEEYDDPVLKQILNFNLQVKTTRDYKEKNKKPLSEITWLTAESLPPSEKLSKKQKELLSVELTELLYNHHLCPDFPPQLPNHMKYKHLRTIWEDSFPVVTQGVCYIELCSYDKTHCPFKGYCSTCDELELKLLEEKKAIRKVISNIYQYCDLWCEKCNFTISCTNYKSIQHSSSAPSFHQIGGMQKLIVQKLKPVDEVFGYKIQDTLESEPWETSNEKTSNNKKKRILGNSRDYSTYFHRWETHHSVFIEGKQMLWEINGCQENILAALTILRQYGDFIYSKIRNASFTFAREHLLSESELNNTELNRTLMNGSAKAALIGIDRSILAWEEILPNLPELTHQIQFFINHLNELRTQTEKIFPDARSFIQPGFDEI